MNRREALSYLRLVQPALVPIAAPRVGLCCEKCRSGVNPGWDRCYQCAQFKVPNVLPISLSLHAERLHRRLRDYKEADDNEERREHALVLAALLGLFLENHQDCLGASPDLVVTVPSPHRDALTDVVKLLPSLRTKHIRALNATGSSAAPRYELNTRQVDGQRVLVLDDTFTSGKSIAAAHTTLVDGGATIIGPLVIGRHFHTNFPTSVDLWDCLETHKWSLDRCGICAPVDCPDQSPQTSLL